MEPIDFQRLTNIEALAAGEVAGKLTGRPLASAPIPMPPALKFPAVCSHQASLVSPSCPKQRPPFPSRSLQQESRFRRLAHRFPFLARGRKTGNRTLPADAPSGSLGSCSLPITVMIAATFGPLSSLSRCIQFFRPKAIRRMPFPRTSCCRSRRVHRECTPSPRASHPRGLPSGL
jgi:hypothetical protein